LILSLTVFSRIEICSWAHCIIDKFALTAKARSFSGNSSSTHAPRALVSDKYSPGVKLPTVGYGPANGGCGIGEMNPVTVVHQSVH
jgi:hypothetical protein